MRGLLCIYEAWLVCEEYCYRCSALEIYVCLNKIISLTDVLYKPVERVMRTTLVLQDLLKHTPHRHPDYQVLRQVIHVASKRAILIIIHCSSKLLLGFNYSCNLLTNYVKFSNVGTQNRK